MSESLSVACRGSFSGMGAGPGRRLVWCFRPAAGLSLREGDAVGEVEFTRTTRYWCGECRAWVSVTPCPACVARGLLVDGIPRKRTYTYPRVPASMHGFARLAISDHEIGERLQEHYATAGERRAAEYGIEAD